MVLRRTASRSQHGRLSISQGIHGRGFGAVSSGTA